MTETTQTTEPRTLDYKKPGRRKVKVTDIVIFSVMLAIIVVLAFTLITKLQLKHDVSDAQAVADKTITDLDKRDGTAARKLGSQTFQKTYTATALTQQFKAVEIATLKTPKLDRTTVYNGSKTRTVFFIYKYTALKVPFFVRVGIAKESGSWKLTQISGSADESKLIIN